MRDEKGNFIARQLPVLQIQLVFRDGVERGGRLVKHQDGRVLVYRFGEQQLLLFPARKIHRVGINVAAQTRLQPRRQGADLIGDARLFERGKKAVFFPAAFGREVFGQRHRQEAALLEYDGKKVEAVLVVPAAHAVYQNRPVVWRVQPAQKFYDRRFARAVFPDNRNVLSGAHGKGQVAHRGRVGAGIGKGNVGKRNRVNRARFGGGLWLRRVLLHIGAVRRAVHAAALQPCIGRDQPHRPVGKAGQDAEIEKKIRNGQRVLRGQIHQIQIRHALAHKVQQRPRAACGRRHAQIGGNRALRLGKHGGKRTDAIGGKAVDFDFLGGCAVFGKRVKIIELLGKTRERPGGVLLPAAEAAQQEKLAGAGQKHQRNHPEADAVQQRAGR